MYFYLKKKNFLYNFFFLSKILSNNIRSHLHRKWKLRLRKIRGKQIIIFKKNTEPTTALSIPVLCQEPPLSAAPSATPLKLALCYLLFLLLTQVPAAPRTIPSSSLATAISVVKSSSPSQSMTSWSALNLAAALVSTLWIGVRLMGIYFNTLTMRIIFLVSFLHTSALCAVLALLKPKLVLTLVSAVATTSLPTS